jgi:hypothetical protein
MSKRNQGGIMGPGGKNVAPIYKMQGGMMGPAPIQGPQLPKKKKPSIVSKIKKAYKAFEEEAGNYYA